MWEKQPENDEVTVEMIVNTWQKNFLNLFTVAEENWIMDINRR